MKGTLLNTSSPSWRITSPPQSRSTSPEKTCDLTRVGQTQSNKEREMEKWAHIHGYAEGMSEYMYML